MQGPVEGRAREVLTPEALAFLNELHLRFEAPRLKLLEEREARRAHLAASGGQLDFLPETRSVRDSDWRIAPVPRDLQDRRVEITGPVDRKMMINALNSGAKVFMADFEDANSPTWANVLDGQVNCIDAARGTIALETAKKTYTLGPAPAVLVVRPRGWHLPEKHLTVDGQPMSASLVDAGLFLFHNAQALVAKGSGPYLYLPKLEGHREARLWNDVFLFAQERLGLPTGTIKATVLIETLPAAFEMDEILYELRDHAAGLNAGRWDYIFSAIKTFRERPDAVLPDRGQVTMTVPFMQAYAELLVKTCHRRGAHAMGGMAAFIPSRKDAEVNERALAKVREDKLREASQGFDGTWVAHPDLVPVAKKVFDAALGQAPNQVVSKPREDVQVTAAQLQDLRVPGGKVTEAGLRGNVDVGLQYIAAWLGGNGAAAIHNLMEDAATAEIARSQLWQWLHHGAELDDGRTVTRDLVTGILDAELARLRGELGPAFDEARFTHAKAIFEQVALQPDLPAFLTLPAYDLLP